MRHFVHVHVYVVICLLYEVNNYAFNPRKKAVRREVKGLDYGLRNCCGHGDFACKKGLIIRD